MNRNTMLLLVIAAAFVQLAVPVSMIARREAALARGTLYRFPTAPVDPADPFRGRYVALSFRDLTAPLPDEPALHRGDRVHARIATNAAGEAYFASVSRAAPTEGDSLRTRVSWTGGRVTLQVPFDRLYLDEDLAPAAEQAYRERSRMGSSNDTFALVRVYRGMAVLQDVEAGGVSLREVARTAGSGK